MKSLSKNRPPRDSSATATASYQRPPTVYVAPGYMPYAVDQTASDFARLAGVYRHNGELVRAHHGIAITVEALPFSAFVDALGRAFTFKSAKIERGDGRYMLVEGKVIDVPQRLARILFESPQYWTEIPLIGDPADLAKAGAA